MAELKPRQAIVNDIGASSTEIIAVVLSVLWIAGVGLFFLLLPPAQSATDSVDSLRIILIVVAVFMPLAMIWVAAAAARSARIMREEAQRLQSAIDAMRQTVLADRAAQKSAPAATPAPRPVTEAPAADAVPVTFASSRDTRRAKPAARPAQSPASAAAAAPDAQQSLALGTTAEDITPPMPRDEFIRALNFPDSDHDREGFAVLRRALKDRQARQLVQASQDVLTLLSQDGIYMDDLQPDRARPEIWRRFAAGERGRQMAALGGVRDRSSLALAAGRMREDTIFRDAAHHFLRRFDQMLVAFEKEASDEELIALSETRTARAFMLLGRVTGAFD